MKTPASVRYLEVSGRQNGKTSRLIQDATKRHYVDGRVIALVTPVDVRHFRNNEVAPFIKYIGNSEEAVLKQIRNPHDLDNIAWYYDEFDRLKGPPVTIREDGYYCTSPRFIRKFDQMTNEDIRSDLLLELIRVNGGAYVSYTPLMSRLAAYAGAARSIPPEHIETEMDGKFFTFKPENRL